MSTVVKGGTGGSYTPHPEGQFPVVCVDVQDLGWEHSVKYNKTQYKIRLVFFGGEWTEEKEVEIDGETVRKRFPMVVSKKFTASLHERATLRKFGKSWRGADFTPQELKDGFDFERMYGAVALLQVEHFVYEGERYAGIDSIMRLKDKNDAPDIPPEYMRLKDRDDWEGPAEHPNWVPDDHGQAAVEPEDEGLPF